MPEQPTLAPAAYGEPRDEHGGLTVAGLRDALAGAPDDALVLVHDEDTGSLVGSIEHAWDDGPSTCVDDRRHIFRINATRDEATLRDARDDDAPVGEFPASLADMGVVSGPGGQPL